MKKENNYLLGEITEIGKKKDGVYIGTIKSEKQIFSFNENHMFNCRYEQLDIGQTVYFVPKKKKIGNRLYLFAVNVCVDKPQKEILLNDEQQEMLYRLIMEAHEKDFKKDNCVVITKLKDIAYQVNKIFGSRPNKKLLSAASNYFVLGYNEVNADCVASTRFPISVHFSKQRIVREKPKQLSGEVTKIVDFIEEDAKKLNELFENSKYIEYLNADSFIKYAPCILPVEFFEKAITAAKYLLVPNLNDVVKLNLFQRELLSANTSYDFIQKWKSEQGFVDEIILACADSTIVKLNMPQDNGIILQKMNSIGYTNTHNDNYAGLTQRFLVCENEIIPYIYLVRIFANKSQNNIERCITEYCQIVKDLKQSVLYGRLNADEKTLLFKEIVTVVQKNILGEKLLTQNIRTNIVSTFVDVKRMDCLREIIEIISPDEIYFERRVVDLILNYKSWNETMFSELFNQGGSLQLLQKSIALIWEDFKEEIKLPKAFLTILAWIIKYDQYSSVDEILRYHFTNKFTKLHKQKMLLRSFLDITLMINESMDAYNLAAYVALYVFTQIKENDITEDISTILNTWNDFSDKYYEKKLSKFPMITKENKDEFVKMFSVFKLDKVHENQLQSIYSNWVISEVLPEKYDENDINELLDRLYLQGAYEAYSRVYGIILSKKNTFINKKNRIEQYFNSLINMQHFVEMIEYVYANEDISANERDILTERVICENFKQYGLEPKAYLIFNEKFTIQNAEELILQNLKPNKYIAVTALIAIYIKKDELIKAFYLNSIFQTKAENGYTRFYSQYRRKVSKLAKKIHNHYDVIHMAFMTLPPEEIIEFFKWTKKITIPNFKSYNPTHVYAYFFDALIEEPLNYDVWEKFFVHLVKRPTINAWMICVCEEVIRLKYDIVNMHNLKNGIETVLEQTENVTLPYNFMAYAALYIMESGDVIIAQKIYERLNRIGILNEIICDNPWYKNYNSIMNEFSLFCMKNYKVTKNQLYYNLIAILNAEMDYSQMAELSLNEIDKQYLFRQICRNFFEGQKTELIIEIFNNVNWEELDYREREVINLLKVIYSDDEELYLKHPLVLKNEEKVERFKKDCMQIISYYPKNEGLHLFEEMCSNNAYKYLVFSYVFGIFYDEDVYDKYREKYSDLRNDEKLLYAYLNFMKRAQISQLEYNATYSFFYKKWRYLKLYINEVLRKGREADDVDIICIMQRYKHIDEIYEQTYILFKEDINKFWEFENISFDEKRFFLFSLMEGNMSEYLKKDSSILLKLSDSQIDVVKRLILNLDYREVNLGLYEENMKDIYKSDYERILLCAEKISDYVYDTVIALKKYNTKRANDIFREVVLLIPSACIHHIVTLEQKELMEFRAMLIPLMCSKQFPFQIYAKIRNMVVYNRKFWFGEFYEYMSNYMAEHNHPEAISVYHYLRALSACLNEKKELVCEIIEKNNITSGIPSQWENEAKRIQQYAYSTQQSKFIPDKNLKDTSQSSKQNIKFAFVEKFKSIYGIEKIDELSKEEIIEFYEKFRTRTKNLGDRVEAGIRILCDFPKDEKELGSAIEFPSYNGMVLEVGLLASSVEFEISNDDKIQIIIELYENKNMIEKEYPMRMIQLNERFNDILQKGMSIRNWQRYYLIVGKFLQEQNKEYNFEKLCNRIIKPSIKYFKDECSVEERYNGIQKLLQAFHGLEFVLAQNVMKALQNEIMAIEKDYRLHVDIVNENKLITDGYVYFQVKNTGKRAVLLNSDNCKVKLKISSYPEKDIVMQNICNLRTEEVTGGRGKIGELTQNDSINVSIRIIIDGVMICKAEELLNVAKKEEMVQIPYSARYDVDRAVIYDEELFGRDEKKIELMESIPYGKTVIYGPSRIGKTSLLNWVRNSLAEKKGNVISVLYGGEELGKFTDYKRSFVDEESDILYDDDKWMAEYLLIDTILTGIEDYERLRIPGNIDFHDKLKREMIEILKEKTRSVRKRYSLLNQWLKKYDLELWILLDEFQQVVEKWKPEEGGAFVSACESINRKSNIRLIICGSDDLLKHMVLEDDSVWRTKIFTEKKSRISVGPLDEVHFKDMIKKEKMLENTKIKYSEKALEALYVYTGGVALYGKEICNSILDDISVHREKFIDRNIIYTSDISEATQRLLIKQEAELNTGALEGIRRIYDAVTKNLDDTKDKRNMQYLCFMAQWLKDNPNYQGFPIKILFNKRLRFGKKSLNELLSVAQARGIIRELKHTEEEMQMYKFNTLFFYDAFKGKAREILNCEESIFVNINESEGEKAGENSWHEQVVRFEKLSYHERALALPSMYNLLGKDDKVNFRNGIAEQHIGDNIQGNKVEKQNNIQINVQSITNILSDILTAGTDKEKLLKGIQNLPRLNNYISFKEFAEELQDDSEENVARAIDNYVSDMEEGIEKSVQKLEKQGITLNKKSYHQILGVTEAEYECFMEQYDLPEYFLRSLQLAYRLELLFDKGMIEENCENIDYSPITIMYGKLVEGLLKEYHIKIYSKCLNNMPTNMKRIDDNKKKYKWSEIEKLPLQQQQKLTIGSFVFPLLKDWCVNSLVEKTKGSYSQWEEHKKMISEIKEIRDSSAHYSGGEVVTFKQKNDVTRMLFKERGLMRILKIVM